LKGSRGAAEVIRICKALCVASLAHIGEGASCFRRAVPTRVLAILGDMPLHMQPFPLVAGSAIRIDHGAFPVVVVTVPGF